MPHADAGPRMLPPVSDPSEPMHSPAATAAPEPLLEPPGMWSGFHGLRAGSKRLVGGPPRANSCIASLPSSTVPAAFSRATTVASCDGTRCSSTFDCAVVRTPAVSYRSFRAMGMPCSGPRYSPATMAASAARASATAESASTVTYEFRPPSTASMRSKERPGQLHRRKLLRLQQQRRLRDGQVVQLLLSHL